MRHALARQVAFDPDQPRDENGRWTDGGASVVASTTVTVGDGTVDIAKLSRARMRLKLDGEQGSNSTVISAKTARDLMSMLDRARLRHGQDSTFKASVATYDTAGPPAGYVGLTQTGPDAYELELLTTDATITMTNKDLGRFGQEVAYTYGTSRVDVVGGTAEVYLTRDGQFGLRAGDADVHLSPTDWTRMRDALNVVWEGFDESSQFGHSPDDDVTELHIPTQAGEMLVRHSGGEPGANAADPTDASITLSVSSPSAGWSIEWPAHGEHPMFGAFQAVETADEYVGGFGRTSRKVTGMPTLTRRTRETSEPPPVQYGKAFTERSVADEPAGSPIPFVASTQGVQRDGIDLRASGWKLDNFRRNPVFLWAHDYASEPLGRVDAGADTTVLRSMVVFDQQDERARRIESKYRRGFLNAVSVGWDFVDQNGQRMSWWTLSAEQMRDEAHYDLLELSAVPVPADPAALVARQRTALSHLGRELVALFDEQEDPRSRTTAPEIRAAVLAELVRMGLELPTATVPAPQVRRIDEAAARTVLAAFDLKESHA